MFRCRKLYQSKAFGINFGVFSAAEKQIKTKIPGEEYNLQAKIQNARQRLHQIRGTSANIFWYFR